MKKDYTDITVILDRSGSMASIKTDMEGGFATFLEEQKALPGEAKLSLFMFDDKFEKVYENLPLADVPPLVLAPRGTTALLDAIGRTVAQRGSYFASLEESERPEKVIVLILTDGAENASVEYSYSKIKGMVTEQTEKYSWEFVFLGANIDSFEVAKHMGIQRDKVMNYSSHGPNASASTYSVFSSMSKSMSAYRSAPGSSYKFEEEDLQAQIALGVDQKTDNTN